MQNIYKLWQHNSKGCAALKSNAAQVEANRNHTSSAAMQWMSQLSLAVKLK